MFCLFGYSLLSLLTPGLHTMCILGAIIVHPFTNALAQMRAAIVARNPKDKQVTLYIEYSAARKVKRIPTGYRIAEKHWDNTGKQIKANGTTDVTADNKSLSKQLSTVNTAITDFHTANGRWCLCDELTDLLAAKATPAPATIEQPQATPVTNAIATYIAAKQHSWQPLTIKSYNTLVTLWKGFGEATGQQWAMETLTNADVNDWQTWLMETKNYKNSTLGKQVKKFKEFLHNSAVKPQALDASKVTAKHRMSVSSAIVTLTAKEIAELYRLDLSQRPSLERVRDLFVLQCYTGLRYSDVCRLRRADIQGGFIKLETQKTVETTNIPLFKQAQAILEKYGYDVSRIAISNQKQNESLKELLALPATLAAIPSLTREIKLPEERGTVRRYPTVPLYTVITTHAARKSFITMCLERGASAYVVKEFSGHKTDASFARYVNAAQGQKEAAAALQNAFDAL